MRLWKKILLQLLVLVVSFTVCYFATLGILWTLDQASILHKETTLCGKHLLRL